MKCGLCADACRIDGIRPAADYIFVESVLHKSAFVSAVPQTRCVTLVLSEKCFRKLASRIGPGMQKQPAEHRVVEQKVISICVIDGFVVKPSYVRPQDHWLRNQAIGSKCSVAASGPRLATVIRIRMSLGDAFAYSAKISK